jgi:hypothetical protein
MPIVLGIKYLALFVPEEKRPGYRASTPPLTEPFRLTGEIPDFVNIEKRNK